METFRSDLSGQEFPVNERVSGKTIRHSILSLIQKDKPGFSHNSFLAQSELTHYREQAAMDYLIREVGELTDLEKTVLESVNKSNTLSDKLDNKKKDIPTFGERLADKVASFGGSWTFILCFAGFIVVWMMVNVYWLYNKGFDPYPFILLNLLLSCLAAFQAPVIMMSQNRQEEKDRDRARKDYMINLKSELELRLLHEKIDHFISDQHQELVDLQKAQMNVIDDILKRLEKKE